MATIDTGPLGTLTFISAEPVDPDGTGEAWLRVRYSLDTTDATEALTGFLIWHDDEAGSTTPVWVDAADAELAGGGDSGDPAVYEVLVSVPLSDGHATYWETFYTYPLGTQIATMTGGGTIWDGAWNGISAEYQYGEYYGFPVDSFTSYPVGTQTIPMNGGYGFDGPWVGTSF